MSSIVEARTRYSGIFIPAVYASAAAAFLAGQVQDVRAGVFEQTCNGKVIAIGSGTLLGVPLHHQARSTENGQRAVVSSVIEFGLPSAADPSDVSAGATLAADAAPPSICADPPAETTNLNSAALKAMRRIEGKLSLPEPQQLSRKLSEQQIEMREMAADVGLRFARTPGVHKAKLDTPAFIKLFTTLVHRESSFKPQAVSPAGARGLGQLMPATARGLGVKDSFSPNENLVGAATYLTDMLDRFGSPELALAAYNAGPNAVEKYRGIPPYRETRQYVADILHEVLREPHPQYVTARLKQPVTPTDSNIQPTAFAAGPSTGTVDKDPFTAVLTETPQAVQRDASIELAAYASTPETATIQKASFEVAQGTEILPTPESKQNTDKTRASKAGDVATRATPLPPDLTKLPEPRAFLGELSKAQLVNRDLATDIAVRHANVPGVARSGLSEEAFVTLFVALIRRESSFNNRAVSPDGAKGLGQLEPATVRELGIKDPLSAQENLEGSVKYFNRLLDEFSSPALALAAYNAGPAIVREKGGIPGDRKTRQFLANVLHDIKNDPLPDFVVARLSKKTSVTVASSEETAKQSTDRQVATKELAKSRQPARMHSAEQKIERPVFAATINPIPFSGWTTGGLTFAKFIAALGVAFVITGLCSAIAASSGSGPSGAPGWKRALRWPWRRGQVSKIDDASQPTVAAPEGVDGPAIERVSSPAGAVA